MGLILCHHFRVSQNASETIPGRAESSMLESAPCLATSSTQLQNNKNVVLINTTTLHEAESQIESCEHCNPDGAEIPFDNILDRVTGSDPSVTDYILEAPAKCPNCCREILEKTLR